MEERKKKLNRKIIYKYVWLLPCLRKFEGVLKNSTQSGALFQEPLHSYVQDFSVILHDIFKHQMNISPFTFTRLLHCPDPPTHRYLTTTTGFTLWSLFTHLRTTKFDFLKTLAKTKLLISVSSYFTVFLHTIPSIPCTYWTHKPRIIFIHFIFKPFSSYYYMCIHSLTHTHTFFHNSDFFFYTV